VSTVSGNRNEVFAGGFIYYPDNPKPMWSMDKTGKAVFYYQREIKRALYERRHLTSLLLSGPRQWRSDS
jgi:hypothetical protein